MGGLALAISNSKAEGVGQTACGYTITFARIIYKQHVLTCEACSADSAVNGL